MRWYIPPTILAPLAVLCVSRYVGISCLLVPPKNVSCCSYPAEQTRVIRWSVSTCYLYMLPEVGHCCPCLASVLLIQGPSYVSHARFICFIMLLHAHESWMIIIHLACLLLQNTCSPCSQICWITKRVYVALVWHEIY